MSPDIEIEATLLGEQLAGLGVELPKGALGAFGTLAAARSALDEAPVDDLVAAALAGELTPSNVGKRVELAAQRVAVRANMRELVAGLAGPLGVAAMRAMRSDAGPIVDKLRPQFDAAAADVVAALRFFDVESFNNPAGVLQRNLEAASPYHRAAAALPRLDAIAHAVQQVVSWRATRLPNVWLFVEDDGTAIASDVVAAFTGPPTRWLALLGLRGVTPRLNLRNEAEAVAAAAVAREQAPKPRPLTPFEQARSDNDRRDARRLAASTGPPPPAA